MTKRLSVAAGAVARAGRPDVVRLAEIVDDTRSGGQGERSDRGFTGAHPDPIVIALRSALREVEVRRQGAKLRVVKVAES